LVAGIERPKQCRKIRLAIKACIMSQSPGKEFELKLKFENMLMFKREYRRARATVDADYDIY
jgi:hypothetical protein